MSPAPFAALLAPLFFTVLCPPDARVDRVEGSRVVLVLGSSGVRVIAASRFDPPRAVTEGDRVAPSPLDPHHRCVARAPSLDERRAFQRIFHALERSSPPRELRVLTPQGSGGFIPRPFSAH